MSSHFVVPGGHTPGAINGKHVSSSSPLCIHGKPFVKSLHFLVHGSIVGFGVVGFATVGLGVGGAFFASYLGL